MTLRLSKRRKPLVDRKRENFGENPEEMSVEKPKIVDGKSGNISVKKPENIGGKTGRNVGRKIGKMSMENPKKFR